MKVNCKKIVNPITNQLEEGNNWLTIGKTYVVLSILIPLGKKAAFILISDDNSTPLPFDPEQFKIICNKIPSCWEVFLDEAGDLKITPAAWTKNNFWNDYFNSDQDAIRSYQEESNKIIRESI